jgi:acyl carrier protein
VRCGLPSNFPDADFAGDGVCGVCRSYEIIKERAQAYFGTIDELPAVLGTPGQAGPGQHDLLMLYSGGKDSTYALCRLSELGYRVYAFTLDNGFISDSAKDNIRRVTARLGVPIEFATTSAMNAIFRDSLARFSNVCNGCFKTIYTLGMLRARELGIPAVVTGLSRGQMFETRLSEEVFGAGVRRDELDSAVLAARKAYHRTPDELSRLLDVSAFQGDEIFDAVRVVDFYRYCDVSLEEMLAYLDRMVPWIRPADTGRSTNCLINELGIFVHKKERGYHSYALPYSWDVRLGHKSREAALEELDDDIDPGRMRDLMSAIGCGPERLDDAGEGTSLAAFYVGTLTEADVRIALESRLPAHLVPLRLERLDAIPLTANGKVDERALARDAESHAERSPYVAPKGPVEEFLAAVWQQELGVARVGGDDSFFALGGTSLSAMRMVVRLCQEFDIDIPLAAVFTHPQLTGLARVAENRILEDADRMDADPLSSPQAP